MAGRAVNDPDTIYFYCDHEPRGRYWELAKRFVTPVTIFVNPSPGDFGSSPSCSGGRGCRAGDRRAAVPIALQCVAYGGAGAEFGRLWLEEMRATFDGSWSAHWTLLPERLRKRHSDLLHIEPQRTFYKHPWTREAIATLLEDLDADFDGERLPPKRAHSPAPCAATAMSEATSCRCGNRGQ